jgi:hypothetical protein
MKNQRSIRGTIFFIVSYLIDVKDLIILLEMKKVFDVSGIKNVFDSTQFI